MNRVRPIGIPLHHGSASTSTRATKTSQELLTSSQGGRRELVKGTQRVLKMFIFLLCCMAFMANSYQNMRKYMDGKTTVTENWAWAKNKLISFPTLTICPEGPSQGNDETKESKDFHIGKLLRCQSLNGSEDCIQRVRDVRDYTTPKLVNFSDHRVVHTRYRGKCFSLSIPLEVPSLSFLKLPLTNSSVVVYLHEPGEEFFIISAWYPKEVPTRIHSDEIDNFLLVTLTKMSVECEESCHKWTVQDQINCLKEGLWMNFSNVKLNCTTPYLESLLHPYSYSDGYCQSLDEIEQIGDLIDIFLAPLLVNGCPVSCTDVKYLLSRESFKTPVADKFRGQVVKDLFLSFTTTATKVAKTVLLSSTGDVISSVGGNLGLFLDFSLISLLYALLNAIAATDRQ